MLEVARSKKIIKIETLIKCALCEVDDKYYRLDTAVKNSTKFKDEVKIMIRERFFCYEFYHQMRCYDKEHHILDNNIVLSAEISKNGHELIKNNKIPDFIIHEPGSMGTNLVIIEVKAKIDEKGIAKDFNTLSLFLSDCSYELGILILFNCDLKDLKTSMKEIVKKEEFKSILNQKKFSKIKILCKKSRKNKTEEIILKDLISELDA